MLCWNRFGVIAASSARIAFVLGASTLLGMGMRSHSAENVYLTGAPDYDWHLGCFGTATGNLMGYWDRHGFPDFYTGNTGGGIAPLTSFGSNRGIRSLWASQAGVDGRPTSQPGHLDDYWVDYQSAAPDPYVVEGRDEHTPDCTGDFIGLNQRKWGNLAGECSGNIDGYAFNFFEPTGERRENFAPVDDSGGTIADIQSGLRAWTRSRGAEADTFSQLTDFNPHCQPGKGFTFADLKAEIDAGYPVLLFMQAFDEFSRIIEGQEGLNPQIHALLAYGYVIEDTGASYVRYRTSWGSGDNQFSEWNSGNWTPNGILDLPLRGVIGYRPLPRISQVIRSGDRLRVRWQAPLSVLRDVLNETERPLHVYVLERTSSLENPQWDAVTSPTSELQAEIPGCCEGTAFFRLRLVTMVE